MNAENKKLSDREIKENRTNTIMNIIAERCAYYRANPHRFAEDFIPGLKLRIFQKILSRLEFLQVFSF